MTLLGLFNGQNTKKVKNEKISLRSKYAIHKEGGISRLKQLVEDIRTLGIDYELRESLDLLSVKLIGILYKIMKSNPAFRKFEVEVEPNGGTGPQIFKKEDMYVKIVSGEITDQVTGTVSRKGDVYSVLSGRKHNLISEKGAKLIMVYSNDIKYEAELFI